LIGRKHASDRSNGIKDVFRALQYRNYRLFFAGQGISLIGTWLQWVALSWLVYKLTSSALLLGIVGFSGQISIFLLSPFAGVMADRLNQHKMLLATQTLAMLHAFALSALVLTHLINIWHIIGLSIFIGLVNGFDMPTRQAFVVHMVEKREDLPNAIALNSSMFNSARLIGPLIAGALIAVVGVGGCFLINGLSYVAVIIALLCMKINHTTSDIHERHPLSDLMDGFHYTFRSVPIRSMMLLLALTSFAVTPNAVLMPIFATKILHGNERTLGFLMGSTGIGALIGAMALASRKSVLGLTKWIAVTSIMLGVGLIAFSFSKSLWLCLVILSATGFAAITQMGAGNTIIQTIVDDKMRGRVMSWYAMAFVGTAPFASLMGGAFAHKFGAPRTVALFGAFALLGGIAFVLGLPSMRKHMHLVYEKKGIIS
jgi:MFS family permease